MAQRPPKKSAAETARPAQLEDALGPLEQALPGVEILDRGLEFDGEVAVEFAGVDDSGRLVLGLFAGDDADRTALAVLDALSFARRNGPLLARHLPSPRLVPGLESRVILIAEPADEMLLRRLAPLIGRGVEVLELRTVKSRTGERSYLLCAGAEADASSLDPHASVDAFLEALPAELQELGRLVVDRMGRLDDELSIEATLEAVAWFYQRQLLVRLEHKGDLLRAGAGGERPRELRDPRDVDTLLEDSLSRLVEAVGQMPLDGMPDHALRQREGLPLLTPEEIEAFRD